jgi:hypothetical protein
MEITMASLTAGSREWLTQHHQAVLITLRAGGSAQSSPCGASACSSHLCHHCRAAEYFNLPRDRTLIVGSRVKR